MVLEDTMKDIKAVNVMPGNRYNNFTQIYISYANKVIAEFVAEDRPEKISRAKIETQVLGVMDRMGFPTEFRLAYFSMVAHTDIFDVYWMAMRDIHHLSKSAIARVKPDYELIFSIPPLNPPDTPTGSGASSDAASVAATDPGSDVEFEPIAMNEADAEEYVPQEPKPSLSPAPEEPYEEPQEESPEKPKRGGKKGAGTSKAKSSGAKRKAPPAQKKPRGADTEEQNLGDAEEEKNPDAAEDALDDGNDGAETHDGPQSGQTGGKSVELPKKTGTKRGRSTSSRGRGGGRKRRAKKVRTDDEVE